jgi:hypothetical protein
MQSVIASSAAARLLCRAMKGTTIQDPIATVSFGWVDARGEERPVRGMVGKPYQLDDQQWACPYVLDGAFEQGPDVPGGDSIQALSLALYGLYHDLIRLLDEGGRLLNPTTRETFDLVMLKATFSRSTSLLQAVT